MPKVTMRKYDNGYRAIVEESTSPSIPVDTLIQNRKFHPFKPGTLLQVVFNISLAGKRMLRSVMPISERDLFKKETAPMSVTVPEPQPVATATHGYYVSKEARLVYNTALAMSKAAPEKAVKLMMVGPSGYGKTTLPQKFANILGYRYMRMNCATIRDPEEWFGFREAREGSTVFIKSEFAKAIEGGNLVCVLDEFNRLEPWLHNTLFPLLDDDGKTIVHDQEFKIGSNVIVVGTINTGYRYTGTFELDEALYNRFDFVLEVGPMPADEEMQVLQVRTGVLPLQARRIVKMANLLRERDVVCSTRSTLLCAKMVCAGMTEREAFESVVVRRLPADSMGSTVRKSVVDQVNAEFGPCHAREMEGDIFALPGEAPSMQSAVAPEYHQGTGFDITVTYQGDASNYQLIPIIKTLRNLPLVHDLSLRDGKDVAEQLKVKGVQWTFRLHTPLNEIQTEMLEKLGLVQV